MTSILDIIYSFFTKKILVHLGAFKKKLWISPNIKSNDQFHKWNLGKNENKKKGMLFQIDISSDEFKSVMRYCFI